MVKPPFSMAKPPFSMVKPIIFHSRHREVSPAWPPSPPRAGRPACCATAPSWCSTGDGLTKNHGMAVKSLENHGEHREKPWLIVIELIEASDFSLATFRSGATFATFALKCHKISMGPTFRSSDQWLGVVTLNLLIAPFCR